MAEAKGPKQLPKNILAVVEALDEGKIQLALKRSETLLERHPSSNPGRALRALALELAGCRQEALQYCSEVRKSRSADPQVLGLLRDVYNRADMLGEVSAAYEAAVEEDPENESNMVSLHLALVKECWKIPRQQHVALLLHRRFTRPQYLYWAAAAIMLQVKKVGPHRSCELGEALLQRFPVELKSMAGDEDVTAQELWDEFSNLVFHISSLRQQGKYPQALNLLEDHSSAAPLPEDAAQLCVILNAEAGNAVGTVQAARSKFLGNVKQWLSAKEYISAAFFAEGFLTLKVPQLESAAVGVAQLKNEGSPRSSASVSRRKALTGKTFEAQGLTLEAVQASARSSYNSAVKGEAADFLDFAGRVGGAIAELAEEVRNNEKAIRTKLRHEAKTKSFGKIATRRSILEGTAPKDEPVLIALQADALRPRGSDAEVISEWWAGADSQSSDQTGQCVKDAFLLFRRLQAEPDNSHLRVVYLAEIEMRALALASSELEGIQRAEASVAATLAQETRPTWPIPQLLADYHDFADCLGTYYARFGHLGGCYTDLKPYLSLLDSNRTRVFMQKLDATIQLPLQHEAEDSVEEVQCREVQRRLNLARFRHGLRVFVDSPQDVLQEATELACMWADMVQQGASISPSLPGNSPHEAAAPAFPPSPRLHDPMAPTARLGEPWAKLQLPLKRAGNRHSVLGEDSPSVEAEDLLCLAALHLLELDRIFCRDSAKQKAALGVWLERSSGRAEPTNQDEATLPSISQRNHLLDALGLLELGLKYVPSCGRMRLLLATIYGAVGAASSMRRWCDSLGMSSFRGGPLGVFVLDRLSTFGAWDEALEACSRLRAADRELEAATRAALVNSCEETARGSGEGGRGLQRICEFRATLESTASAIERGRGVVEEATMKTICLRGMGQVAEYLNSVSPLLEKAKQAPDSEAMAERGRDLSLFQSFHELPRCTPLQALRLGSIGVSRMLNAPQSRLPTAHDQWHAAFRQSPSFSGAACSFSSAWPAAGCPSRNLPKISGLPRISSAPSGCLQDLLTLRKLSSTGVIKLRAKLLLIVQAILRPKPNEAELSELLKDFQDGLARERVALHCDPVSSLGRSNNGTAPLPEEGPARATPTRPGTTGGLSARQSSRWRRVQAVVSVTKGEKDEKDESFDDESEVVPSKGGLPPRPSTSPVTTSEDLSNSKWTAGTPNRQTQAAPQRQDNVEQHHDIVVPPEVQPLQSEDLQVGLPPPWRSSMASAEDIFWRCTFLACDVAHRLLQAIGSSDVPSRSKTNDHLLDELLAPETSSLQSWTCIRRLLQVIKPLVRACVRTILRDPAPECIAAVGTEVPPGSAEEEALKNGAPFCFGGNGLQLLTSFLEGPMLIIGPVIHLLASAVGPAGSFVSNAGATASSQSFAKSARRTGHFQKLAATATDAAVDEEKDELAVKEEAEAVRQALAELSEELQTVLKEIVTALLGAQWEGLDHGGFKPSQNSASQSLHDSLKQKGIDLETYRQAAMASMESSHRKQLMSAEKVVRTQMDLLASIAVRQTAVI